MSENKISKKLKIGSIAGGLAFGGFSFCGLNDVDADIVRWANPNSVGVAENTRFFIADIDGDGVDDLEGINYGFGQGLQAAAGGAIRTNEGFARGFNTGLSNYEISGANPNDYLNGLFLYDGVVADDFQGGSVTRNFAFDFVSDGQTFFGWGTVQYNGPDEAFTIIPGYYEDEGNSLFVGEVGAAVDTPEVPEPSSLMLLGLGAAGLAGFRRKRSA